MSTNMLPAQFCLSQTEDRHGDHPVTVVIFPDGFLHRLLYVMDANPYQRYSQVAAQHRMSAGICEYLDDLICNDDFMDQKGMEDYNEKLDVLKSIREKMVLHNYYFTFGSDPKFPFYKGYLIVKAESINVACDKFEKKYPGSLPYTINCSAYYTEEQWKNIKHDMGICHEVIE